MKKSITSKNGKSFEIEFSHSDYFNILGCKAQLQEKHPRAPKSLVIVADRKEFLAALGMDWARAGKPADICINLTDADFSELSAFVASEKNRIEEEKEARLANLPVKYRAVYEGLWADGDCIPTKVTFQKYKIDNNVIIDLGGRQFDSELVPDLGTPTEYNGGFPIIELTEQQYNDFISEIAPVSEKKKEEKRQADEVTAIRRKEAEKNYTGVHIEYGDNCEYWDGIRMD